METIRLSGKFSRFRIEDAESEKGPSCGKTTLDQFTLGLVSQLSKWPLNFYFFPSVELLKQPNPEDCCVQNQFIITCKVPPQDWTVLTEIKRKKLQLRIGAFRDKRMSENTFPFE